MLHLVPKIITASENNWKVPDGVKKIRVYMVGAGGGGASGGIVLANQLGNLKEGYYEYKDSDPANTEPKNTGGEFKNQKISDLITTKTESKFHPTIDSKCKSSGYEKWESNITSLSVNVTGCGAGGAGSWNNQAGGGSGGYKTQNGINLTDNYIVRIPGKATLGADTNASAAGFSSGAGGGGGHENSYTDATCITKISAAGGTYGGNGGKGNAARCNSSLSPTQGEMVSEHLALMVEALMAVAAHKAAEEDSYGGGGGGATPNCNTGGGGVADLQFL